MKCQCHSQLLPTNWKATTCAPLKLAHIRHSSLGNLLIDLPSQSTASCGLGSVFQGQQGLHQASNSSGTLQMSNVGFDLRDRSSQLGMNRKPGQVTRMGTPKS